MLNFLQRAGSCKLLRSTGVVRDEATLFVGFLSRDCTRGGWHCHLIAPIFEKGPRARSDNTLGSVIGDDGMTGIEIGGTYLGEAFKQFQLAIARSLPNEEHHSWRSASKNDYKNAGEPFESFYGDDSPAPKHHFFPYEQAGIILDQKAGEHFKFENFSRSLGKNSTPELIQN